ncbi:AAA family ATPase [Actinosynnema sp. NPDC004786]
MSPADAPDRNPSVYVMPDGMPLAVDVALATGRPLLLRGDPGSGKSSLARHIAHQRKWRYYEHVVTARTQARDLLWTYDSVHRLADAQTRWAREERYEWQDHRYVEPGVLWWAFAPGRARRRGVPGDGPLPAGFEATDPCRPRDGEVSGNHAVVLVDEIDKADPDLPNGLLVPLGSGEFDVSDIGETVRKEPPAGAAAGAGAQHLVVVTTNEERELPPAFLRRCVVAWVPDADHGKLVEIAVAHLAAEEGAVTAADRALADALAGALVEAREQAVAANLRKPSTAEFLDAFRACRQTGVRPGDDRWELLRRLVLVKTRPTAGVAAAGGGGGGR